MARARGFEGAGAWFASRKGLTFGSGTTTTFGASGLGADVKAWGDTASNYLMWDSSANRLYLTGTSVSMNIGTFASAAVGSGSVLSSSQTAIFRVYADDGGAALSAASVPDYRGALSRVLVTKDNSSNHLRLHALMGHLKSYDGEWKSEQISGVHGYLELVRNAGTINFQGYGVTAGVQATVETSGTMTLDANHVIAGVTAISKLGSGLTQTGNTAGVYVGIYDDTNWSDTSITHSKWKYGIYIKAASVNQGIKIGELSSTVAGSGVALTDTYTRALEVNADDADTARSTGTQGRAIFGRVMIYADNACEDWGVDGLCKLSGVAKTGNVSAGVVGRFESTGTCSLATGAGNTYAAGVMGRVGGGGTFTIADGTYVSGVLAFYNTTTANAFTGAYTSGFHVATTDIASSGKWDFGLYVEADASNYPIQIGRSSSSAAVGHHLISTAKRGITFYGDDNNAVLGADVDGIYSRVCTLATQNGAYAANAIRGHLRMPAAGFTPSGSKGAYGVLGYVELSGTSTIGDGSNFTILSALGGTFEGATTTIAANAVACGLHLSGKAMPAAPTGESVGILFQAITQGFEHTFGFSGVGTTDGNGLTTGSDSTNVTHKIAVWINGVGTRYLHVFSD